MLTTHAIRIELTSSNALNGLMTEDYPKQNCYLSLNKSENARVNGLK